MRHENSIYKYLIVDSICNSIYLWLYLLVKWDVQMEVQCLVQVWLVSQIVWARNEALLAGYMVCASSSVNLSPEFEVSASLSARKLPYRLKAFFCCIIWTSV